MEVEEEEQVSFELVCNQISLIVQIMFCNVIVQIMKS